MSVEHAYPSPTEIAQMPAYERIVHYQLVDHPGMRGRIPDREAAWMLSFLGMAFIEEQRHEEALAAARRALALARACAPDDGTLLATVLLNLGVARFSGGDLAGAVDCYRECWTHARRADDTETLIKAGTNALSNLRSSVAVGDAELALLRELVPLLDAHHRRSEAALAVKLIGETLLAHGALADAIGALDEALARLKGMRRAQDVRRSIVDDLLDADAQLPDPALGPPLGPGARGEVSALVIDGAECLTRGLPERAERCLRRALSLLTRRRRSPERVLAAYLFLMLGDPSGAAQDLERISPGLGRWVHAAAHARDVSNLIRVATALTKKRDQR
jgi:tetratricopeptide (TPR) repeat protein